MAEYLIRLKRLDVPATPSVPLIFIPRLLKDRIVFLSGPVTDGQHRGGPAALPRHGQPQRGHLPVHQQPRRLGDGRHGDFDTMQHINAPVRTVCVGMAASMGAFLLAGAKGWLWRCPTTR